MVIKIIPATPPRRSQTYRCRDVGRYWTDAGGAGQVYGFTDSLCLRSLGIAPALVDSGTVWFSCCCGQVDWLVFEPSRMGLEVQRPGLIHAEDHLRVTGIRSHLTVRDRVQMLDPGLLGRVVRQQLFGGTRPWASPRNVDTSPYKEGRWQRHAGSSIRTFGRAARLVRETGKPIAQVAGDLGINEGTWGTGQRRQAAARGWNRRPERG
jgi:hypothetical protein